MDLLNATRMQAGYTLGTEPSGRERLVVAVKGTFVIPQKGEEAALAEEQLPLIEADSFTGEPGYSAPLHEVDYAPRKKRCDVLLNGTAYAPGGKPTARVTVGLKVGTMAKSFDVVGKRLWDAGSVSVDPGYAGSFVKLPISYDKAFGGLDNFHADSEEHRAFMPNPIGVGYHHHLYKEMVDGTPMPNTEERHQPIKSPRGPYWPMAFGPIGRGWEPRYKLAGTYDQNWVDKVFPFLPADFDEAYYQAAPADQQMAYPKGGEEVRLVNLTPDGRTGFRLPRREVPVVFFLKDGGREEQQAVIDTLVIEPDEDRFTMTWRASHPLKRNMFEVVQVVVGQMSRAWWRARDMGKTYHPGLGALVRAKRAEEEELA